MTHDEFRQQYEDYPWDPYQPLAVLLADGRRAYVDRPEEVRLDPDELVLTRRAPRHPERYRYADISCLVSLLELPADPGGMSYAEFDPLIRELLMAEPFRPFTIELKTGEVLEIRRRPEIGRFCRHITLLGEPPRSFTHYTFDQVARLVPSPEPVPA